MIPEFKKDAFGRVRIGNIYGKYNFFDLKKPLVISFSHLGASVDEGEICSSPSPWAFDYLAKNNINCLCFAGIRGKNNFYRDADFIKALKEIGESLPGFTERLGYGTSMGAYAAAAFSSPLGVSRVLLGSPISTRKREINNWDLDAGRSVESYNFDWNGPYIDAAASKASGYVIYDPLYGLDAIHAKRFTNLKLLKLPGAGHSGFDLLNQAKEMDWVFKSFLDNDLSELAYYKKIRKRKSIPSYYFGILGSESTNINTLRASVVKDFLSKNQPAIYNSIPDIYKSGPYERKTHGPEKHPAKIFKNNEKISLLPKLFSPFRGLIRRLVIPKLGLF